MAESYTPGDTQNASEFMSRRSLESHGQFFAPHLSSGVSVLDCGCGPGTITLGIAAQIAPARVVGIDFCESQITKARASAQSAAIANVDFRTGDCYSLLFDDRSFDRVFSHALLEHLSDPVRALGEMHRVLKVGGTIGVCSPDWGGFLLTPPSPSLSRAMEVYAGLQSRNGGDPRAGRKLGEHLASSGFRDVRLSARYECYPALEFIGEYLAIQLEQAGDVSSAAPIRAWSKCERGMFAQAWVAATASKLTHD